MYLVKEANGWKELTGRTIITKSIKKLNGATIHVAEYNFLKDYYISITGVANSDIDACVHAPGKDYRIIIDGVSVIMFK